MNIVSWIIVGIAAGWFAGIVTQTRMGPIGSIVLGSIGALIGGWITSSRVEGDAGIISSIIVAGITAATVVLIQSSFGRRTR